VLAAIYYLGNKGTKNFNSSSETLLFLLCTLFTLLLAFLNRRGSEYFIPCSGMLLCHLLSKISFDHWKPRALWFSFCIMFLVLFISDFLDNSKAKISPHVEGSLRAADSLPHGNIKVFNCEWDRAPYIIYKRPNAKIVDILDPSLLYFSNEKLFYAKSHLNEGKVGDPSGLLTQDFKADFVYCANPVLTNQLQKDPNFQQISPKAKKNELQDFAEPSVFKIRRNENLPFIKEADGKFYKRHSIFSFRELNTKSKEQFTEVINFENSFYLNLETIYKDKWIEGSKESEFANCALISPTKEEINRFSGSRYIGLGGGRNIRLWVNGKEFYESKTAFLNSSLLRVLVPLEKPLTKNDLIEVMSCSSSKATYWGIAISFWNNETISNLCSWKREAIGSNAQIGNWIYSGEIQDSCLAPIAVKTLSEDMRSPALNP
jgi:hypothetical protein